MNWLKTLVLVLAMLLFFLLAALTANQQEMPLYFAKWQTPIVLSMFWWLLAAFVIGLLFGLLNGAWFNVKHRLSNRRLKRQLEQANAELERVQSLSS